jgi:uncharacterized membrane protein
MKKYAIEIRWALVFTGVALLWMVFEKMMGWHGEKIAVHPVYTNFFAIIAIAVYVFALRDKRQKLGGKMSWKEGFIAGLIISILVALLSPLSQYIVHTFLSPEYFPNAIEYAVESEQLTREKASSYFNLQNYMIQSAIGAIILGVVTSAIVALFVRTKSTD